MKGLNNLDLDKTHNDQNQKVITNFNHKKVSEDAFNQINSKNNDIPAFSSKDQIYDFQKAIQNENLENIEKRDKINELQQVISQSSPENVVKSEDLNYHQLIKNKINQGLRIGTKFYLQKIIIQTNLINWLESLKTILDSKK